MATTRDRGDGDRDWRDDYEWQRRFYPMFSWILQAHVPQRTRVDTWEAPLIEDREHNTDFMVLRIREETRVSCRVRRFHHALDWRRANQITIRNSLPSGARTELAKVLAGHGDFLLYCFANPEETSLCAWVLGRLDVLRRCVEEHPGLGELRRNDDGTTFRAYYLDRDLPPWFVVARQRFLASRLDLRLRPEWLTWEPPA